MVINLESGSKVSHLPLGHCVGCLLAPLKQHRFSCELAYAQQQSAKIQQRQFPWHRTRELSSDYSTFYGPF